MYYSDRIGEKEVRMISILAGLFIKDKENTEDFKVRQIYGMLCSVVGIFLNVLLFAGKALAGILSSSIAITADAFNNLSDAASSLITLVGFKLAGQKPDPDHPFGHGRIEYISGMLVAFLILLMAFELVKSSVDKILHPAEVEATPLIIGILIVSVFVKLYMFFYNQRVGKSIDSAAMMATAKDSVSDALATSVILITTLLAKYVGLRIDGYCGLVVALIVLWAGISAARDTISPLLGQPPEPEFVEKIEEIIMCYEDRGVIGIHDLVVHNYGPGRVMLSVHVEVPSSGDILALHDMIDLIEHRLKRELECSAVIHMDPVCVDDETTNALKEKVAHMIAEMEGNIGFHDFRIVQGPTHTNIIFDVVVPFGMKMTDEEIVNVLADKIHTFSTPKMEYFAVIEVDRDMYGKTVKGEK